MNLSGLPAASLTHQRLQHQIAPVSSSLHALLLALEIHGWSWKSLRQKGNLKQLGSAMQEATKAAMTHLRANSPFLLRILSTPLSLKILLFVAPLIFPMNLEKFIQVHFTKVGDQTLLLVEETIAFAQKYQQEHTNILALLNTVKALRK